MNYRAIIGIIGKILLLEAILMLPAMLISYAYGEQDTALDIAKAVFITAAVGAAGSMVKSGKGTFHSKEGLVTVGTAWILVSAFGALPFYISREIPSYVDCFFEMVSGFTTTGATILTDIEGISHGLLYWRSFSQWIGGMGVLVFILAFASLTGKNSGENMHLLRAESPGIRISKLVPRMKKSSAILYGMYVSMTVVQILLLVLGKVPLFDSVNISLTTAGTGGFAIKNDSMLSYSSYAKWVTTVFMMLYGINFGIYFMLILREFRKAAKSEELRTYLLVIVVSIVLISVSTCRAGLFSTTAECIREVAFAVVSVITTTGFVSYDFDIWTQMARTILVLLMFIGAMAGSTGGGMKVVRVSVAFKSAFRTVRRALHPDSVSIVRMDGQRLDEDEIDAVNGFVVLYFLLAALATLLISLDGFTLTTNFTAVVSCLGNVGPGMDGVGATMNYSGFSDFSKIILSLCMLLGRLELFPLIALVVPSTYRK